MEVLFKGHWHSHTRSDPDFTKRDSDLASAQDVEDLTRVTIPQATLFILWVVACVVLGVRFLYARRKQVTVVIEDVESLLQVGEERRNLMDEEESGKDEEVSESKATKPARKQVSADDHQLHGSTVKVANGDVQQTTSHDEIPNGNAAFEEPVANVTDHPQDGDSARLLESKASGKGRSPAETAQKNFSKVKPPPTFDSFLLYAMALGAILLYFFYCDVLKGFPAAERAYVRDQFLFLVLIMFLVAMTFTVRTCPDKILNRDQTEEWKGWMQVMFVWYHYFKAAETYNLVRVYIACYVWMTGFGNFSFFWIRKDYSLWRMIKMLFRLNFLVILVLMTTNNSYMLYYICAMHTYWFFSVYLFMFILRSWNERPLFMAAKFVAYFVCNALIFDTPLVQYAFRPLWFVLGYQGSMHEWQFRAGLDHYACFVGMVCAYNYPHFEHWMNYLDKRHVDRRDMLFAIIIKAFIVGLILVLAVIWYREFMLREKYDYNRLHPYTSWFPIVGYLMLRNLTPWLRTRYLAFFTFLGKITLETYISQLHIFLQGNATELIAYIPGYPLLNFSLATAIYLFISYWLFEITTVFSTFLLPQSMRRVGINLVVGFIVCSLAACVAFLLKEASVY
ncbi:uncharacterized protein [Diadema antillarum]|uniref:uncharacterized protein n=1 Tax=Diadema antillarum TaxID=105358 RepID=UPI003A8B0BC5